jgi:ABC-type transporter Mla subunit MlaD
MASSPFINEFDSQMKRLVEINNIININIQARQAFSKEIVDKLGVISKSIKDLEGNIKGLLENIDRLRAELGGNEKATQDNLAHIAELEKETAYLRESLAKVIRERDTLMEDQRTLREQIDIQQREITRLDQENKTLVGQIQQLQNNIAVLEAELKKIQQQQPPIPPGPPGSPNPNLQDELNRVNAELATARADLAAATAELTRVTAELKARTDELAAATAELTRVRDELTAAQQNLAAARKQIYDLENATGIANEGARILTEEKERLEAKIKDATATIKTTMDNFNALMATIQAETPGQNAEIQKIIGQIEGDIANLQSYINGGPPPPRIPPGGGVSLAPNAPLTRESQITIKDNSGSNINISYPQFRDLMKKKIDQLNRSGNSVVKYQSILDEINLGTIRTAEELNQALSRAQIVLTGDHKGFRGGKNKKIKNKKTKKQKGGYIYNLNTKRRTLSSSRRSSSSKRSSRRRSSRRSSRNSSRRQTSM